MIDDEAMVDAIDGVKGTVTPEVIALLERNVRAARSYAAKGSGTDAALVPGLEALLVLARELAQ